MKTLNLSEIGRILMLCVIICMGALTGCSEDEEIKKEEFTFPELTEKTMTVGETLEISFNATEDWTLSSKDSWCKFINGDFEETIISGNKGEQKITAKISETGQDYIKDHNTEISLKMGDKEQMIYKITRPKKVFEGLIVKSVPEEGEEAVIYSAENPIVIKGCDIEEYLDESLLIQVSTTDESFIAGINEGDNPSWVKIENEEGNFALSFNRENTDNVKIQYTITKEEGYTIKFAVKKNNELYAIADIPVVYEGLKEGAFAIMPSYYSSYSNFIISESGKKMSLSNHEGSSVYIDKIETNIITRNDEFEIIKFEQKGSFKAEWAGMEPTYQVSGYVFDKAQTDWVHVETESGKCTLTFDPYVDSKEYDSRSVVVMAIPSYIYEEIKDDLERELIDNEYGPTLNYEYQNYVIAAPVQRKDQLSISTNGIVDGKLSPLAMMIGMDCTTKYEGEPIEGAGTENIYASNIYSMLFTDMSEDNKLYYEIKEGPSGITIETEKLNGLSAEFKTNDNKDFIVLSANDISNIPLGQNGNIRIKSSNGDTIALLIINVTENPKW